MQIAEYLLAESSDRTAIIANDKLITYTELYYRIGWFSQFITCTKGDHIAIFGENSVEWISAFYACWNKQCIPVPIDFMSAVDDVAFIIDDCKPSMVFCSAEKHPTLLLAFEKVKYKPNVVVFDEANTHQYSKEKIGLTPSEPNDTAVIIYTSGTTGSPKGVMLSFANLKINIDGVANTIKVFTANDRVLMLLPLHHIFPLQGTLIIPLYVGATVIICPSLNPADILHSLKLHSITMIISVPRFYQILFKGIRDKINRSWTARLIYGLSNIVGSRSFSKLLFSSVQKKFGGKIRYMVTGGAAIDPKIAKGLMNLGFEVLEGYGMTEAAPMIAFSRPGNYLLGYTGTALPGTKIEIREGEIVASGPNIMQGYLNKPVETAEILRNGWLYTGDFGEFHTTGQIRITGRKKEIIVLPNGKNINPEILETQLVNSSAYIKEAGIFMDQNILQVVIIPDFKTLRPLGIDNYEEYFKLQVLAKFNQSVTSYYKILKLHLSPNELPKTRLGKIQRFQLKSLAKENRQSHKIKNNEPVHGEFKMIRDYLKIETLQEIYADDHIELDLALDSLSKITLLVYLENAFGVKIPEEEFFKYPTVRQLSDYIHSEKTRSLQGLVNWSAILKEKVSLKLPKPGLILSLFNIFTKIILRLYFRLVGEGTRHIPEGPCIIVPNHQSFIDGFFVTSFLRRKTMKNTYVYAKEKYWRGWFLRTLAQQNNIILMDINKDLKLSLQKMTAVLEMGRNLIIFPEGTRTRNGKLGQFKKTFAILSHELNIPVVPVVIKGSFEAMPAGAWIPRPFRKVKIEFLQPVYPLNHTYDSLTDLVQKKVSDRLI